MAGEGERRSRTESSDEMAVLRNRGVLGIGLGRLPPSCSARVARVVEGLYGACVINRFGETMRRVVHATEDAREGMAAAAERRAPHWQGR